MVNQNKISLFKIKRQAQNVFPRDVKRTVDFTNTGMKQHGSILTLLFTLYFLTLPADQNQTNTCANRVDPDELAHNKLSHLDLNRLPFCF